MGRQLSIRGAVRSQLCRYSDWLGGALGRLFNLQLCALNLQIIEDYRRQNHPWNPCQPLSNQEAEECEPHRIFDSSADDSAVEEILKLMQDDQIRERDST